MKLTVIIPAYNEVATLTQAVARVKKIRLPGVGQPEIIVVDDGSTDGTRKKVSHLSQVTKMYLSKNQGKGAAIRKALTKARGDYVLIQDADMEYDPQDIKDIIKPVLEGKAEVVYGSRFLGPHRNMLFWHLMGNKLLSSLTNILYNTTLSDMEVGYKLFPTKLLKSLKLTENRFGFEPEVTCKALRQGIRIFEVPISYTGREFHEGKKITWKDGVCALWLILKFRFQ
jgi:glycosyltransferase involved in cell wall biosynthesis